jgi:hypothetical protein
MAFLSTENAAYVAAIFQGFMREKYGLEVNNTRLVTQTMNAVYQSYPQYRNQLEQLNKITLTELKEKVLQSAPVQVSPPSQTPVASLPTQAPSPVPEPLSPEIEFVQKLQKLEQQRISFVPPPPNEGGLDVKAAEMVYSHPQSSAGQVIPTSIQTVYMPAPARVGQEIKIASWQRDWLNYPKRNGFYYTKPLPPRLNYTDVVLGCLVIPGEVAVGHPILSVYIEGPNNQDHQLCVLLERIVGGYGIYKPVTVSLSFMYLLALPWRITLEAVDGETIDLGSDKVGFRVVRQQGAIATLEVSESDFARVGDSLRVYSDRKILPGVVTEVRGRELDVRGTFVGEGHLLNYSRQVTLLLDAVKN